MRLHPHPRARPTRWGRIVPGSGGSSRAFSLVEVLVVLVLIGALVSIAGPALVKAMDDARAAQAAGEIAALGAEISVFWHDNERYPDSLAEIGRAATLDPYGNPYYYANIEGGGTEGRRDRFLVPVNSDFDLYSSGKDEATDLPFTASVSRDDIVRANNGLFVGLAKDF